MSTAVAYDPALFVLERAQVVSAELGEFILGESELGATEVSTWVTVPAATFTMSCGYNVNADDTLIIEADTASVSLSFWDEPGDVLYPSDRIRATYNGEVLFRGTVDSTSMTYDADPSALEHGKHRRVDFTASIAGTYATMMGKTVCWTALPTEPPLRRIRRWVTVSGWTTGLAT